MKLGDFVISNAIVPDLASTDRDGAIDEMIDALIQAGACEKAMRGILRKKIIEREKGGSTGFGKGVAVPHVKHEKIERMAAGIGISQKGIDFNALDKEPVYSVMLLLSPVDKPDEHLQAMEKIFAHLQKDTFRRFLRQSTSVEAVVELIQDADNQQL